MDNENFKNKNEEDKVVESVEGFVPKSREEIGNMNAEEAREYIKVLDAEFQKISEDPELEEKWGSARWPIDKGFSRIFDQFPELQAWYENEI